MKLAFDIKLMRPACVLVGADPEGSKKFDAETWLLTPTPDMRVYDTTPEQLQALIARVRS